ncbi:hypothetical protein OG762_36500 [Streptomyces sp. NBC_01136]|uniref:hypothetical protein n=1 Tax=Streptomyces sp. NBC_01136 TaxID=2903754 RepID=UPI003869421B|nr:hypothetical protein OG762_36500 [Streptomyces sp. NBC_01136]
MRAYDFWDKTGTVESGPYPIASLSLRANGRPDSDELQMLFPSNTPAEVQLAVADRVLAGVQRWRDSIAAGAERQRTAIDELAAAREEIARLKADAEEAA